MYLLYLGVTHRVAPLSILERVHFSDEEKKEALLKLKEEKSILEDVILSTCNRTELYLVVDQLYWSVLFQALSSGLVSDSY